MNCHCGAALTPHEGTGAKLGALHCYECNCCFQKDGKTPREGVPQCAQAPKPDSDAKDDEGPVESESAAAPSKPSRGKTVG